MNHELNKNDSQLLEVNLLNQLKLAKRVNLFDYSLEELQAVHEYWRSMNRYSKQVEYYGAFCSSRPELEQHHSGQKAAALEACDILAISSRLLAPSITARP